MKRLQYLATATALVFALYFVWAMLTHPGPPGGTATQWLALLGLGAVWGWLVVRLDRRFRAARAPAKTWPGRLAGGLGLLTCYLAAGMVGGYVLAWFPVFFLRMGDTGTAIGFNAFVGTFGSIPGVFLGLALELRHTERRTHRDKLR